VWTHTRASLRKRERLWDFVHRSVVLTVGYSLSRSPTAEGKYPPGETISLAGLPCS